MERHLGDLGVVTHTLGSREGGAQGHGPSWQGPCGADTLQAAPLPERGD